MTLWPPSSGLYKFCVGRSVACRLSASRPIQSPDTDSPVMDHPSDTTLYALGPREQFVMAVWAVACVCVCLSVCVCVCVFSAHPFCSESHRTAPWSNWYFFDTRTHTYTHTHTLPKDIYITISYLVYRSYFPGKVAGVCVCVSSALCAFVRPCLLPSSLKEEHPSSGEQAVIKHPLRVVQPVPPLAGPPWPRRAALTMPSASPRTRPSRSVCSRKNLPSANVFSPAHVNFQRERKSKWIRREYEGGPSTLKTGDF